MLDKLTNWSFLNEPLWRWFVFIVAMGFIMWAWRGILSTAKEVID